MLSQRVVLLAYLVRMETDDRVQFVCFETTLDKEDFVTRWEQFTRSLNSNVDVTLQQSERNGMFRYIAQHRSVSGELEFKFFNPKTSRIVQVPIKTTQAGGYSILQAERSVDSANNESKIFVFISDARVDLNIYKQLATPGNFNIYQAYYENCKYTHILEYFVKNKNAADLHEQLKKYSIADIGIYKECIHVKNKANDTRKGLFVWPTG